MSSGHVPAVCYLADAGGDISEGGRVMAKKTPRLMKNMTEPQLGGHLQKQLDFIKSC